MYKRQEGIHDVVDHSSREGMRIVIDLKKDANPQVVLNQLFAFTQMQTTFGVIMLALVGGEPRILTLKQMLEEYIKYQKEVITRRTLFELARAKERAHIFEALKVCLLYTSTKAKLGNTIIGPLVNSLLNDKLVPFLEENPAVAKAILEKSINAARVREAAQKARELARKKSGLANTRMPEKLADCIWSDADRTEPVSYTHLGSATGY